MVDVSVLLPTFNEADCIQDALQSLSNQTFEDFEVLVVDDGSTDGTREIVKDFPDHRIRLIVRDSSGLPSALNRGIREAAGKYIARQDADDQSDPTRLQQQYEYLENHPDTALLGTGAYVSNTDVRRRRVLENPTYENLLSGNRFIHGSVMMRASAVKRVGGYDERFEYTEDYDLWLRLAEQFPIANIDQPLYTLTLHSESIYGSVLREVKLYGLFATMRSAQELPDDLTRGFEEGNMDQVYEVLSNEECFELHRTLAMEFIRYGNFKEAKRECVSAFQYKIGFFPVILYLLSLMPNEIVNLAVGGFRLVKNFRIRIKNRL